ncbi:MAG: LamG domain-containing protein [Lachnospiraceae bacterium]|nr:LamG domain-containing protein [Lachnospiraceae bacterium]
MKKKFFAVALAATMVLGCASSAMADTSTTEPVFYYTFEEGLDNSGSGTAGAATIVGGGSLVTDSERGQVFDNNSAGTAGIRVDYLSLPQAVMDGIVDFESEALTVAMWVKLPAGETLPTQWLPIFVMRQAAQTDAWPFVNVGIRGTSQYNWGGWADNNVNADITYLNDNAWHYVVATYDATAMKVYVDGVQTNAFTATAANVTNGFFCAAAGDGTFDVCAIGGYQVKGWEDNDATILYDDVAIYDSVLSETEITQISTNKSNNMTFGSAGGTTGGNGGSGNGNTGNGGAGSTDTADMAPVVAVVALAAVAAVVVLKKRTVNE